jgi:hypothetical protein
MTIIYFFIYKLIHLLRNIVSGNADVKPRLPNELKRRWEIFKKYNQRRPRGAPSLRFWVIFLWQTFFGKRDLRPLSREVADPYSVQGLENLPRNGVFTVAVNHNMRRWLPRLLASVQAAADKVRPDLAADWLVIVGYRHAKTDGRPAWQRRYILTVRGVVDYLWGRWSHNALRLPMADKERDRVYIESLRVWKNRAQAQPTVVFPEGRGSQIFEDIRPGAGRWLAGLGVPVIPASVWWDEDAGRWHIVFGPPVRWSQNPRLHDLQLGLEIAYGLPPEAAPGWQNDLQRWRDAHAHPDRDDDFDDEVEADEEEIRLENPIDSQVATG